MTKCFSGASKLAVLGFAVVAALAMPLGASAHGWNGNGHHASYRSGYSGGYYGHGGYGHDNYYRGNRGGHWEGGRWIAGAIVAGAVIGLINNASRPAPVYYEPSVVYSRPGVVYDEYYPAPVVRRRVVETRTIYEDPYQTRYIRGDDDDDGGD